MSIRIAFLTAGEVFASKYCVSLAKRGHEMHLLTCMPPVEIFPGIDVHKLPFRPPWGYYLNSFALRRLLRTLSPDILHVSYAGGYGTLGRLGNYHPSVLSVWGSDVLLTPFKSAIHRAVIRRNLACYDAVCATSSMLAKATRQLQPAVGKVLQTPIGVDTRLFAPGPPKEDTGPIVIGTVKTFERVYGLDILVRAFAEARRRLLESDTTLGGRLRLVLVGNGRRKREIIRLVGELGLDSVCEFMSWVPNRQVPEIMRRLDIFVAASRSESFGVAVVEASACALPVIVSRIGGLPEVCQDGVTGWMVESENVSGFADAMVRLARNPKLRRHLGENGRRFVQANYEWDECVAAIEQVYKQVLVTTGRPLACDENCDPFSRGFLRRDGGYVPVAKVPLARAADQHQ